MNQVTTVPQEDFSRSLIEFEETQRVCAALIRTPHYKNLGEIGIYTIVQKARSIGLNPLDALNGAMYFVNGKVELSANTMNYMIRSQGHSITKSDDSTSDKCILKGRRADNGDTWTASFSISEAKRAGIYRSTWEKYPEDMLFARALTRLARQLFPDVIKGCYVEGEIQSTVSQNIIHDAEIVPPPKPEMVSEDKAKELCDMLAQCSEKLQKDVKAFCNKNKFGDNLEFLPASLVERLTQAMTKDLEESVSESQASESTDEPMEA